MLSLSLFTVFHGNLQFSSIKRKDYKRVIDNCYWPLIKILQKNKRLKFGIEFSALTLLEINRVDDALIKKIKTLIKQGKLEFVGSSYTQAIFPLIPYDVNLKNVELGIKTYKNVLGCVPKIFYVNEQTFSDGIIDVYKDTGIENIIVDFDTTAESIRHIKSLLYKPVRAKSQNGEKINVIWSSSIAFQKFQRYIFDELSYEDYQKYLSSHFSAIESRSFCLYGGDWEVFGFSPKGIKRYYKDDSKRIEELFGKFSKDKNIKFILPHQLIDRKINELDISLTNFQDPLLCKKQEKYNVSRWALAGKKTIFRNTQCFRLLKEVNSIKNNETVNKLIIEKLEENLVKLWGSDYRTNTTEDKNREYEHLLSKTEKLINIYYKTKDVFSVSELAQQNKSKAQPIGDDGCIETDNVKLTLDWRKGATIKQLTFPKIFPKNMAGLIPHGYFQNQQLASDWFTGHCLFETDKDNKYTDLYPAKISVKKNDNGDINLSCEIKTPIGAVEKIYKVYQDLPKVDLQYIFNFKKVGLKSVRIGNITLDPTNFDSKNLWYSTVNGGKSKELFKIGKTNIAQDELVSFRISSRGCLGTTDGWIAVGDNEKGLVIIWDKAQIASCPVIHFEKTPQGLFARIQPSIAESDETGFPVYERIFSFSITYLGLKSLHELDRFNFPTKIIKR